jgi:hypothetical protein
LYDFEIKIIPEDTNITLTYGVLYQEGEQPFNSIGEEFDIPYPAGTLSASIEVTAAYAIYDGEHRELDFTWFTDEAGSGYLSNFASESTGTP